MSCRHRVVGVVDIDGVATRRPQHVTPEAGGRPAVVDVVPAGILAARFSEELHNRREMLRGRVVDALRDGKLDPMEKQSIRQLQEELGLSEGDVERIVRLQQQIQSRHKFCPHCGEFISQQH